MRKSFELNYKVAIKILEKSKIIENNDLERVNREIKILKKLNHENIIENEENYYFILEYAFKGELFDFIVEKKRLSDSDASLFLVQIINGLEHIHKNNIVHRDIKPENLLLSDHKQIKIIDFGLSNYFKSGRLLHTACGSPCYAAPEMIKGKPYSGIAVDIWSVGVVLYAMVCGYLPYEDSDNTRLYNKIISGKLEFPNYISLVAKNLIRKILNVNPKLRLKIDEIKAHPFYKIGEKILKQEELIYDINLPTLVLEKMDQLGYDKNKVIQHLDMKRHNSTTSVFYLLLKKLKSKAYRKASEIQIEENDKLLQNGIKIIQNRNININIKGLPKKFEGNININFTEPNATEVKIISSNLNRYKRNLKDRGEGRINKFIIIYSENLRQIVFIIKIMLLRTYKKNQS